MADLLLEKQLRLHHSISRSLDNFKKIGRNNLTAATIRFRISVLKDVWQQYQDNHDALTRAVAKATRTAMEYFTEGYYELAADTYATTMDYMHNSLEALAPVVSPARSVERGPARSDASSFSVAHLPPIRLPPFDGNYADWETFRDRFTALIIQNKDISDFARMYYLESSLQGRARECIGNLAITADNFNFAWRTVTARFENKRRLLAYHLSALLGLSTVKQESASELQVLCDKSNSAIASLANLNRTPSELWNDILVHIITQKLDPATRKAWNLKNSDVDTPPTHEDLNLFLSSRIRALEESAPSYAAKAFSKPATSSRVHYVATSERTMPACPLCQSRHYLNACSAFIAQNPTQRRETVKRLKRCFNCLSGSHASSACRSKFNCRSCDKRHHSLLHAESDSDSGPSATTLHATHASQSVAPTVKINSLLASAKPGARSQVLLATAWIRVKVASGRTVTVRALLDQGSEATFISEKLTQTLRAKHIRMPTSISAVGGVHVSTVRHAAEISLFPRASDTPSFSTTALILESLTSYQPKRGSDLSSLAHLSDLEWADADPTSSDPIQMIIGADIYSDLILTGVRKGQRGQPFAQQSVFGWIISGPLATASGPPRSPRGQSPAEKACGNVTAHHCTRVHYRAEESRRCRETEERPQSQTLAPQQSTSARLSHRAPRIDLRYTKSRWNIPHRI